MPLRSEARKPASARAPTPLSENGAVGALTLGGPARAHGARRAARVRRPAASNAPRPPPRRTRPRRRSRRPPATAPRRCSPPASRPVQSVMRALRGATEVDTAYAGAFVNGMLGHESDQRRPVGLVLLRQRHRRAGRAPRTCRLADGDAVWWDYRRWAPADLDARASSAPGPRPSCCPAAGARRWQADAPLAAALRPTGAASPRGSLALAGARRRQRRPRGARSRLATGPRRPRRRRPHGHDRRRPHRRARTPTGRPATPVPGARALVAAVPTGTDRQHGVLVVVAGLDAAAARAAAERSSTTPRSCAGATRSPSTARGIRCAPADGPGREERPGAPVPAGRWRRS